MSDTSSHFTYDIFIDAKQAYCPEPLMLLHRGLNKIASGEKVLLATKDAAAPKDIHNLAKFLKHKLLAEEIIDGVFYFLIQKK